MRRNQIHDAKKNGIEDSGNARIMLEENDVFGNGEAGVVVVGKTTLRHNRIHDCQGAGVYIGEAAEVILEDNDIFNNAQAGVKIQDVGLTERYSRAKRGDDQPRGKIALRRNRILHNGDVGIAFPLHGVNWVFEENILRGNKNGPWNTDDKKVVKQLRRAGNITSLVDRLRLS